MGDALVVSRNQNAFLAAALLAALFTAAGALNTSKAEEQALPGLKSILGKLQKGGFVIYFRHAATERSARPDHETDLAKCASQRNLTAIGREQALQIGKAIRALKIPIAMVTVSPFCRTKDTAQLAFGRFTVDNDLHFAIEAGENEQQRLIASLRRMLSSPPPPATNAVIVAHSANLREATRIWPNPEGVAFVFLPLSDGRYEAVARILPEEWANVALQYPASNAR